MYASAHESKGPVTAVLFVFSLMDAKRPSFLLFRARVAELHVGHGSERVAARDLQKSVLLASERHWVQVPGPLMQGFKGALDAGFEDGRLMGGSILVSSVGASAANTAQRHVVPSWQKPHGSEAAVAVSDVDDADVVRAGGRVVAAWVVKSISIPLSSGLTSFRSCRDFLLSVAGDGERGRLRDGLGASSPVSMMLRAFSTHSQRVSILQFPQPNAGSLCSIVNRGFSVSGDTVAVFESDFK